MSQRERVEKLEKDLAEAGQRVIELEQERDNAVGHAQYMQQAATMAEARYAETLARLQPYLELEIERLAQENRMLRESHEAAQLANSRSREEG